MPKAFRAVLLAALVGVAGVGCGGDGGVQGTYVLRNGTQSIRFNEDGTFVLNVNGQYAGGGTYKLHGSNVTLKYQADGTHEGRFGDDTFTDDTGVWGR